MWCFAWYGKRWAWRAPKMMFSERLFSGAYTDSKLSRVVLDE